MTKIFTAGLWYEDGRELRTLTDGDARLFVASALTYAEFFGLPVPINPKQCSDFYEVYEEPFCQLVEQVLSSQNPMFYGWFVWAASMYSIIKGQEKSLEWKYPPRVADGWVWGKDKDSSGPVLIADEIKANGECA